MKYLLILPLFMACFMVANISSASAHCGVCEASEQKSEAKVCTKCAEAGKPCMCAKKKKTCGCTDKGKTCDKKKEAGKKPCKMCDKSEREYNMKKKRSEIFFND